MSVPYFGHLPGPFFQVCGPEGDAVPLAGVVLFHSLGFLVDKGGDVKRKPPYYSCYVYQFGDGFQLYFPFLISSLYEEGGEVDP